MTHANDRESPHPGERLRTPPVERFSSQELEFDLKQVAKELLAEQTQGKRPHRQRTLYRHGRATVALFVFEAGAKLPRHVATGAVTINVLAGRLRIATPGGQHELAAGNLLILASGIEHDVIAEEQSTMLLQVHLDEPTAAGE